MSQNGPSPPSSGTGGAPLGSGARRPDARTPLRKRSYSLKLTFSMLLTGGIVTLIGVSWVFMLGVMVGRGDNPEARVHEITGRMLRSARPPAVQEPPQAILRPEELQFGHALRDRPLHNSSAAVGMPAAPPATRPAPAANATVAGEPPIQPAPVPPVPQQPTPPARFDFIYQVATFRDAGQTDKLRERLEGEGVRTTMESGPTRDGKKWYKVLAVRRGTEEDEQQLLAILERLKLGAPLLRARKPVRTGAR